MFTNEEQKQIIQMYQNDINIIDIINMFNVEEKEIRKILKDNSIDRIYNTFKPELYDRIIKLYTSGKTMTYISEQLCIGEFCINKTLKKRGIRKRTYSENNRRYSLNEHYFDNIDTSNKAYLLGLLYADGCNHIAHNSITLSLQIDDKNIVEFMKNELEYGGPIRFIKPKGKDCYKEQATLCINSEYMSYQLEKCGLVNNKSLVLTWPVCVPKSLYPHFVRGYFDGDGCVWYDEKRNKCTTQTCSTINFCKELSSILEELNIKHSIKHPKQCKPETVVLQTGGNTSSFLFLDWMYKDAEIYMERKYQKYLYAKTNKQNKMIA